MRRPSMSFALSVRRPFIRKQLSQQHCSTDNLVPNGLTLFVIRLLSSADCSRPLTFFLGSALYDKASIANHGKVLLGALTWGSKIVADENRVGSVQT